MIGKRKYLKKKKILLYYLLNIIFLGELAVPLEHASVNSCDSVLNSTYDLLNKALFDHDVYPH